MNKYNNVPVEILKFGVANPEIAKEFVEVDKATWTAFLSQQDGYIDKMVWYTDTTPSEIFTIIFWNSEEQWKSIDLTNLMQVSDEFNAQFNHDVEKLAFFDNRHYHPLRKINEFKLQDVNEIASNDIAVEYLVFEVEDVEAFVENDFAVWTNFLKNQQGFISKQQWVNSDNPNEVHSIVLWENVDCWNNICVDELIANDKKFSESYPDAKIKQALHDKYDKKLQMYNDWA